MGTSILAEEHLLLGAVLGEGVEGRPQPLSYAHADERAALSSGAALLDLTGMGSRLVSGDSATSFAEAAFAGRRLPVGACALEAVLAGDGATLAIALLARTGDAEYACWDLSGRGEALCAWLGFLGQVEQEGRRAFPGLAVEDASQALVPLALWGPASAAVLADYVGEQSLPQAGAVKPLMLDRISCLVAGVSLGEQPCYLVLVPPAFARVLWRSFLSFELVTPMGRDALLASVAAALPGVEGALSNTDRTLVGAEALRAQGLVREGEGFVGARGLLS